MDANKLRGVFFVIFSVLTALTNLILMTTILCTRQLRLSSKYILVLVLSTCDLIIGLFQYSNYAHIMFTADLEYLSCHLRNALYFYVPYIIDTLRMSLMIALLIDFSLRLMIRDVKLLFKISLSMIACSIVASFVLVFPMVHTDHTGCVVYSISYTGLNVSTYFPQMIVIVFLGATIGYVYYYHRLHLPNFDRENPASPMDLIIAASVMVWLAFPIMVYLAIPASVSCSLDGIECGIDMKALFTCMQFLNNSQTFVIPLVWLSNSKMRSHARCLGRKDAVPDLELFHNPTESHVRL